MKYLVFTFFITLTFLTSCMKDDQSYSGQLGQLSVEQLDFITSKSESTTCYLKLDRSQSSDIEEIEVLLYSESGEELTSVGWLYDDGLVTYNSDDIKGDRIYSGHIKVKIEHEGGYQLVAQYQSASKSNRININAYKAAGLEGKIMVEEVFDLAENSAAEYLSSGYSFSQTMGKVEKELLNNHYVEKIEFFGTSDALLVTLKNNRKTLISFYDKNKMLKGGGTSGFRPEPKRKMGVVSGSQGNQLRGINELAPGNRNVLIYAPHENFFKDGSNVKAIFDKADCGEFNVTLLTQSNANLKALKSLKDYGTIYISTHGVGGKVLSTGEVIKSTHWGDDYFQALWGAEKILANTSINIDGREVTSAEHVWLITYKWFEENLSNLPNSIVFLNACESTISDELSNAFLKSGASCVFGFSESVQASQGKIWGEKWAKEMAQDGFESGFVSIIGEQDIFHDGVVELIGSKDISYSLEFNNGDFEADLREWTGLGDGRAISALGNEKPTQGGIMGLISTGLGKTTSSGSLSQSFIVGEETELVLKYNLHSEEFLEYIGSSFQDKFVISVTDRYGNEEYLFYRTIDDIARDFGASNDDPGNLISTVTDLGEQGVYKTGWQSLSFSLSKYKNKCITLKFYCQDVGDSAYDTAVLLDDIYIR